MKPPLARRLAAFALRHHPQRRPTAVAQSLGRVLRGMNCEQGCSDQPSSNTALVLVSAGGFKFKIVFPASNRNSDSGPTVHARVVDTVLPVLLKRQ